MIDPHTAVMTELPAPSESALQFAGVLEALQFILPVLFFVTALILTSSLFYRMKLREPIALLTDSADRIMANDLDFTIRSSSQDELGQLCRAFESMREALPVKYPELWRQNEERRQLNAAFSHDLRKPGYGIKRIGKVSPEMHTERQSVYRYPHGDSGTHGRLHRQNRTLCGDDEQYPAAGAAASAYWKRSAGPFFPPN